MENDERLVSEVERIRALLRQNQPQLHSMQGTCEEFSQKWNEFIKIRVPQAAMSHPAPVFGALRLKYMQISEVEKHLNPQYCVFWNKADDAIQMYEYVETALSKIGGPQGNSGLFSDSQFSKLRQLFENDKNFAFFSGLSADCPQLFAEEWRNMDLVAQIEVCIQRMDALKTKMDCQLESQPNVSS